MSSAQRWQVPAEHNEKSGVVHRPDGLKYLSPLRASAFLGLVRAGDALARDLSATLEREHGISLNAFEVLLFLAVFAPDGQLRISDLAHYAPLSQSRVSRLVSELETRGLVKRRRNEDDGRGVRVAITESGVDKFRAAQETHLEDLDRRMFSRLDAKELQQLADITNKILDNEG